MSSRAKARARPLVCALRRVAIASAILTPLSLTACGGIEVESKLLDNIGVSGLIGDGKHREKPVEARSGLILPPSTDALPQPGSQTATGPANAAFPQNPEEIAAARKQAAEAKRKQECSDADGAFGSRQSGRHSDQELPGSEKKNNADCSSPLKDLLGNAL
ncbi:MAG: hypothetical protein AAFQ42_00415 [Pseudomonadota bacterium]